MLLWKQRQFDQHMTVFIARVQISGTLAQFGVIYETDIDQSTGSSDIVSDHDDTQVSELPSCHARVRGGLSFGGDGVSA